MKEHIEKAKVERSEARDPNNRRNALTEEEKEIIRINNERIEENKRIDRERIVDL